MKYLIRLLLLFILPQITLAFSTSLAEDDIDSLIGHYYDKQVLEEDDDNEDTIISVIENHADKIKDDEQLEEEEFTLEEEKEDGYQDSGFYYNQCNLSIINKITAKLQHLKLEIGKPLIFGDLEILLKQCWDIQDPYWPSSYVLLSIIEQKIEEDPIILFHGWLISGNVSVANFEHPVYEIIAGRCSGEVVQRNT